MKCPDICVRCRHVDKIIGSSILYILPDLLQLEVHCFRFIGNKRCDKGEEHTDIAEESFEH